MADDLLLKNAVIIDGTGKHPFAADVLVVDGRIQEVGKLNLTARETLDLSGCHLAPGFIDVHTHSDLAAFLPGELHELRLANVRQGVTTEICGNCGSSPFPTLGAYSREVERHLQTFFGQTARGFKTLEAFLESTSRRPLYANLAVLAGHGTVRAAVLGLGRRVPTGAELGQMRDALASALERGAIGLSSGLIYAPGMYAPPAELEALAAVVARFGGVYATHLRDEADGIAAAIDEALRVARATGVSLQISHHKVAGRRNFGRSQETLAQLERARTGGVDVLLDVYPYTATSTTLRALLPPWANEGEVGSVLGRLSERSTRVRLAREYERRSPDWQDQVAAAGWDGITIASAPHRRTVEGRTIAEVASESGQSPVDVMCNLLLDEDGAVSVIVHMMHEHDVRAILSSPLAMIGSDGTPRPGRPHPRWAGSFTRVLGRYAREQRLFSLTDAIRRMTSMAADRFGLSERGRIARGKAADLVAFNWKTVIDRATYDEPLRTPVGIRHVLVNGIPVISDGELTGRTPGEILTRR